MRDDDALRFASRARRVEDVGGIIRGCRTHDRRGVARVGRERKLERAPAARGELRAALRWIVRAQRHVGGACLQDREQRHRKIRRPHRRQRHEIAANHPPRDEVAGAPVCPRVEFRIAQARRAMDHCGGVRRARGAFGEDGVDRAFARILPRRVVPLHQDAPTGGVVHQRQRIDPRIGTRGDAGEQRSVLAQPALDARAVEEIGVEIALHPQRVAVADEVQAEVELVVPARIHSDLAGQLAEAHFSGRRIDVERHRHQRRAARIARNAEPLEQHSEGEPVMIQRVEERALRAGEELGESLAARDGAAQREEIRAVADEVAVPAEALACGRNADDEIASAAEPVQEGLEAGEQHGKHRRAMACGERVECVAQVRRDQRLLACARPCALRRARPLRWQVEWRRQRRILPQPVVLRRGEFRREPRLPLAPRILRELHRIGQRRTSAGDERGVKRGQLAQHDVEGPAVADDVVRGEHEVVSFLSQPHQHGAEERTICEVERRGCLPVHSLRERGGLRLRAEPGVIHDLQIHGERRCDALRVSVGGEGGAQRVVARDELI